MARIMIAGRNWLRESGAVVDSASATASGFGAARLAFIHPSKHTRFTTSPASVVWNLGAARTVNLAFLGHTNATATSGSEATWDVHAGTTSAVSNYVPAAVNVPSAAGLDQWHRYHAIHVPATPQTFQYWRFRINDATAVPTLDVGVAGLYNAFQPAKNIEFEWRWLFSEPGEIQESRGRARYREIRPRHIGLEFTLSWLTKAEAWGSVAEIDRLTGASEGTLVVIDPEEATYRNYWMCYGFQEALGDLVPGSYSPALGTHTWRKTWRIMDVMARV